MVDKLLSQQLERTALKVYNAIDKRQLGENTQRSEEYLWHELVSCILGSKVPFEQAQAATDYLINMNLLRVNDCLQNALEFEGRIIESFAHPIPLTKGISSPSFKYRYPRLRANHIRRTAESIYQENGSIQSILSSTRDPSKMRIRIMQASVGIGPKQSSLFLRNIGFTDSLAILDTHVLRYMFIVGLMSVRAKAVSTITRYQEIEADLRSYSNRLGTNLAYFDTAIWVTMRVFQKRGSIMSLVTLVSGGLDSTLMSVLAREEGVTLFPLFVDYGQLCSKHEWEACVHVHERFLLPAPTRMDLAGYGKTIPCGLTNKALRVNEDAFLPGRNILFLLAACSYAYSKNSNAVAIGLLSEDTHIFPDQTKDFIEHAQRTFNLALGREIRIIAPLMGMNKHDVLAMAKKKGIEGTYSCHAGTLPTCGSCIACRQYID